jgi:hypothetical protein
MKLVVSERLLWMISAVATGFGLSQTHLSSRRSLDTEKLPSMREVRMYDAAQLTSAAESVAWADPFRVERRPSVPIVDPLVAANSVTSPAVRLQVTGTGGGSPWRAIVSGIPGHEEGVLVSAGDTLGGMRVRAVKRDTVIIVTRDSTITFTLKR